MKNAISSQLVPRKPRSLPVVSIRFPDGPALTLVRLAGCHGVMLVPLQARPSGPQTNDSVKVLLYILHDLMCSLWFHSVPLLLQWRGGQTAYKDCFPKCSGLKVGLGCSGWDS